MKTCQCEFCPALKKVRLLWLATLAAPIIGAMVGSWLRPLSSDLDSFAACAGFAGGIILLWDYVIAVRRLEKIRRNIESQN
jgi:uncharacterized membrane protein YeaQ/YmgE (transglycosylase-associated protein family)